MRIKLAKPADKKIHLIPDTSSFWQQTRGLAWPFWAANLMEMIERLAYYGVRVVIPIYIAQADEIGGLHFSQGDKGFIFMWWALVQSALPVFTGGFADRYGYKRQIVVAVFLKVLGYLMMASQREFGPFLAGCLVLAAGTAIFKPPVQGTFAQTLTDEDLRGGLGLFLPGGQYRRLPGAAAGPFSLRLLLARGLLRLRRPGQLEPVVAAHL